MADQDSEPQIRPQLQEDISETQAQPESIHTKEFDLQTAKAISDTLNHLIRTPLGTVITGTQLLSLDSNLDEDNKEQLEAILASAEKINQVLDKLQKLNKFELDKDMTRAIERPVLDLDKSSAD